MIELLRIFTGLYITRTETRVLKKKKMLYEKKTENVTMFILIVNIFMYRFLCKTFARFSHFHNGHIYR